MSFELMGRVSFASKTDECPSGSLHETGCEAMVAFDDVSGQELKPELMIAARRDEIAYFRDMGLYEKVDIAESWKATGKAPIAVR